MAYPIITINREYGARGRSVARRLSERLGLPWYDNDFAKLTAELSGYTVEEINAEGEELSKMDRILEAVLNNSVNYTSSHEAIFRAQIASTLQLAKEPCILVGRCANLTLREAGINSFDVFLHADLDFRMNTAVEIGDCKPENAKKYVHKRDMLRETYYKSYSEHLAKFHYGDSRMYTATLDVGTLGVDTCVDVIVKMLENMK